MTEWKRYQHNTLPALMYDVEMEGVSPKVHEFQGEECYQIQSLSNLAYDQTGRHVPHWTMMPAAKFDEHYHQVELQGAPERKEVKGPIKMKRVR